MPYSKVTKSSVKPKADDASATNTESRPRALRDAIERRKFYERDGKLDPLPVSSMDAERHTMQPDNFKKYIGRWLAQGLDLDGKKFNAGQTKLLQQAFNQGLKIHVISAYRDDLAFLLERNNCALCGEAVMYDKEKQFNCRRQLMAMVSPKGKNKPTELWVLVFPSKQYVSQVAELLRAIIEDFRSAAAPAKDGAHVLVSHFLTLENSIARWTGFDEFIKPFIKHGEVVLIGNIDHMIKGLRDRGFPANLKRMTFGGLDDMFGISTMLHTDRHVRLVMVGIKESFWGDGSAQYVRSMLNAGAMHVLYGSKAATMLGSEEIHKIYSPERFILVDHQGGTEKLPYQRERLTIEGAEVEFYSTGAATTVPTVIGESFEQVEGFKRSGPTCLDCEDGHIAKVFGEFNDRVANDESRLCNAAFKRKFVPVHFITDHIYKTGEAVAKEAPSLGVHADGTDQRSIKYRDVRNAGFRAMGQFFANYALAFAPQDIGYEVIEIETNVHPKDDGFESEFQQAKPFMDSCQGLVALGMLSEPEGESHRLYQIMVYAMICQKEGYVRAALEALNKLKSDPCYSTLKHEDKTRLKVFELKLYSQVGATGRIEVLLAELAKEPHQALLREIRQYGAVKRREAVYFALREDRIRAENSIAAAKDSCSDADNCYQQSNVFYDQLKDLPFKQAHDLDGISSRLSEVRKTYLAHNGANRWWQTNFEKSALAAIFLESAFYLCSDLSESVQRGANMLFFAHLLNSQRGANEVAETYGEIVACTPKVRVRNLLAFAMSKERQSQCAFQKWFRAEFDSLPVIGEYFYQWTSVALQNRETVLQSMLNEELSLGKKRRGGFFQAELFTNVTGLSA